MTRTTSVLKALLLVLTLALGACGKGPAEKAVAHRQRADTYLAEGKVREASIEYQAALQELPNDPDSLYGLARCLQMQGRQGEYTRTLARVLKEAPGHVGATVALGEILLDSANYEEALELASTAMEQAPTHPEVLWLRARALVGVGRYEEAVKFWQRAIESPKAPERVFAEGAAMVAWQEGAEAGLKVCRDGLRRFADSALLASEYATLLLEAGRTGEAEDFLREKEEQFPDAVWTVMARARFLERTGRPAEAAAYLEEARARYTPGSGNWKSLTTAFAKTLLRSGDVSRAKSVLGDGLDVSPGDPAFSAMLADVLITTGEPDEARKYLEAAARLDPGGRTAVLLEAKMHLMSGRPRWAADALQRLVGRGDMTVETHYLLAKALAGQRRWAEARLAFERVLRRVPDHPFARFDFAQLLLEMGAPAEAEEVLKGLPNELRELPRVRFLRAEILLAAGKFEKAAAELDELERLVPGNERVAKLRGDLARALGSEEDALRWYRKARERNPAAWEPLLAEVSTMQAAGRPLRELVKVVEEYLALEGEVPIVLNYLAKLYFEAGRLNDAEQKIDRSLFLEPNYWASRYIKARILKAQGDLAKAAVELRETINLNPFQPHAYNDLAALLIEQGKPGEAEAIYLEFLQRVPGEPFTANNLAVLYLSSGRIDEALRYAERAAYGAPRDPRILDTYGWALEKAGRHVEAEAPLAYAAKQLPRDPEVLLHRAANLASLGRANEAFTVASGIKGLPGGARLAKSVDELLTRVKAEIESE